MTTIIAVKKNNTICIGSDSRINDGGVSWDGAFEKTYQNEKIVIGVSGYVDFLTLLKIYMQDEELNDDTNHDDYISYLTIWFTNFKRFLSDKNYVSSLNTSEVMHDTATNFLLVTKKTKRIFSFCSGLFPLEHTKFASMGTGRRFAIGACDVLYQKYNAFEIVDMALSTAIKYDRDSGGEKCILEIKGD